MDGAFATIRGGGMKTFRAKRGNNLSQQSTLEDLASIMAGDTATDSSGTLDFTDSLSQNANADDKQSLEPELETAQEVMQPKETNRLVAAQQDSGALLESLMDELDD